MKSQTQSNNLSFLAEVCGQVTKMWLGGGNRSRIALALKSQALFLKNVVKEDLNPVPQTYGREIIDMVQYQLAEVLEDYSPYIDTSYIEGNLKENQNGSYFLDPGDYVHLGYQTTANYGRTISMVTT